MKFKFAEMNFAIVAAGQCWITEKFYLEDMFDILKDKLDDSYVFIVGRSNDKQETQQLINEIEPGKKNILILLSDEAGIIPSYKDKFDFIFRTYNRKDLYDNNKIFAIPCGYGTSMRFSYNISDFNSKEFVKKDLKDREYDLFYSGQISPNRVELLNNLNNIKDRFKSLVKFTDGFGKGFTLEEFYNNLNNTKIALVPNGAVVPESFRYFEAIRSGAIVITTYPKWMDAYNHWYYDESPAIFINSWNELTVDFVNNILINTDFEDYQIRNEKYFNEKISPNGLANYILERV